MSDIDELVKRLQRPGTWAFCKDDLIASSAVETLVREDAPFQAADALTALAAENERLREALKRFANVPTRGTCGGPLVCAQTAYEDGSGGEDLGISPHWPGYMPHEWFTRARAALTGKEAGDG